MRGRIAALVGLFVSVGAAVWFLAHVQWAELGQRLTEISLPWVAAASGLLLIEFGIRAVRWQILLRPMGDKARLRDLWSATVIGATANTLLAFRAGEVAKPLVARRRTGYPLAALVATNVMERVFDLLGLVSVLVLMVLVLPDNAEAQGELVHNLKLYGGLLGVFAAACMVIFFALATRPESARGPFGRIARLGPKPAADLAMRLFDGFVAGLGSTKDRRGVWQSAILSIGMWLNGALAIWCLFHAFAMALPFGAACFTAVAVAVTVAVPQLPGALGVFHAAMESTMLLWGQSTSDAQGFAIVFWAVSFLPVTAVGLVAMWAEGLSMADLKFRSDVLPVIDPPTEPSGAP